MVMWDADGPIIRIGAEKFWGKEEVRQHVRQILGRAGKMEPDEEKVVKDKDDDCFLQELFSIHPKREGYPQRDPDHFIVFQSKKYGTRFFKAAWGNNHIVFSYVAIIDMDHHQAPSVSPVGGTA